MIIPRGAAKKKKAGRRVAADTNSPQAPRGRPKTARGNAPRIRAIVVPEP